MESTAVLLRLARVAEAAGAVENALKGFEVDCDAWLVTCCEKKKPETLCRVFPTKRKPNGHRKITLTLAADVLLEVLNLCEGRVLATGTEQIAQAIESNAAVATLVEEGERLLVVCGSLGVEVRRHDVRIEVCDRVELELGREERIVAGGKSRHKSFRFGFVVVRARRRGSERIVWAGA